MKQLSFADAEYAGKRKQTRRERFLIEMDQVVPWQALMALIEPYYPRGEGGRPAYPLLPCCVCTSCRTGSATAIRRWRKPSTR
ncbi:hypothetical protein D3C78_816910 [compost metagenome]